MELSTLELFAVGLIALLVLGPEELVRQSQRMGRLVAKLRTEANNFRIMMESEVQDDTSVKPRLDADQPPIVSPPIESSSREPKV